MTPQLTLKTMTTSTFTLNSVDQKNGKKVSRTKALIAAVFVSLSGVGLMLPEPASAVGYYGKGYVLNVATASQGSNEFNGETMVAGYYAGRGPGPNVYERRGNVIIPSSRCARCL